MQTVADSQALEQKVLPYVIRPMQPGDIPQVSRIERECFPAMVPPTSFRRELSNRLARYLVAIELEKKVSPPSEEVTPIQKERGLGRLLSPVRRLLGWTEPENAPPSLDHIVGFVGTWFMVEEAHIISVAVTEGHRGKGVGELEVIAAIELARQKLCRAVTLEVRRSNLVAQKLYEKYLFAKVGVRKGYYTDNNEDAITMTADDINSPYYNAKFRELVEQHARRWGQSRRDLE